MSRLDSLGAYVPIDRQQALAAGISLPDRTAGAALFADVSGFTPLTSALAQELGPKRGAEEVLVFLNPIFDALIGELHRFGGSVIGFGGDSITCWLDGDDGRRAVACGLGMQEVMRPYANLRTPGGAPVSLFIKVALAVGAARRFAVGHDSIQKIDVIAGSTVTRSAGLEEIAQRGEVIVEEAVAARLTGVAEFGELRGGESGLQGRIARRLVCDVTPAPWPAISPDALPEDQVRSWLLPPVYARVKERQSFLAELRPHVAVLFLRFTGLDYDDDDAAGDKLDAFISWAQMAFNRYDGHLIQLIVGDKGSYVLASFGAPIAHEDNAVRGLAAALDLRAGAASFDGIDPVQIGLSAGAVWTGACGGVQRRTYSLIGDEVNMAARLMQKAAPGQILVTSPIVGAAQLYYHFRSLGVVQVKGRSEPLPVWELIRRRQRATSDWLQFTRPVAGRRAELAQLNDALAAVQAGQGRLVSMSGEAGMGKSHLAAQFAQAAQASGLRLAVGASQSITRAAIYHPWRQIFRTLLALEGSTEQEALASLADLARQHPDWTLRLPLLSDLLDLPLADNPTTAALAAGARQGALFSLLVEMVQWWAQEQPLLLAIENAHWMDEASLALTQAMARQAVSTAPVLLLIIQRSEVGNVALAAFEGVEPVQHVSIALEAMPGDEVAELMGERLGAPVAPLALSMVEVLAQGNPYFVGELVDAMQRGGQLDQGVDGRWQATPEILDLLQAADFLAEHDGEPVVKGGADLTAVSIGVPDSMQSILLARLDRLPEAHKVTLKIGSVIGHQFNLSVLARAYPEDKELADLRAEVEAMQKAEVLAQDGADLDTYTFRHHSMQEVAYETLTYAQRMPLHRAVAEALAELQPDATIPIAYHAFQGEVWSLALRYNLVAGQRAMRLYANRQSIEFFQRALQSARAMPECNTAAECTQIHLALGELMAATGNYEAGEEQLLAALDLAEAQGDREAQARACRWLGRSDELRGDYPAALQWLDRGLANLDGQVSTEEAEIALIAGLIHSRRGDYDQTLRLCERAVQVADRLGDAAVRARAYNLMGIVDRRRGDGEQAIERFRQSLAQYEYLGNVYGLATSYNLIANTLFGLGRWADSNQDYQLALTKFAQMGDVYNQAIVQNNLGGIALKQGHFDSALDYYERAMRLLASIGSSRAITGIVHMNLGNTYLRRRELGKAQDHLQQSLDLFGQVQSREYLAETYSYFAELELSRGDLDRAQAHGRRAVDVARELRMPNELGCSLRALGEIALAQRQFQEARGLLDESFAVLVQAGDEYESARTQLVMAELHCRRQDHGQAETVLAQCSAVFERLGAEAELARARRLQAELR